MYPNAQDVLPLPPRANLAWYRKQAKDLLKAAKSAELSVISEWALQLFEAATVHQQTPPSARDREHYTRQIAEFARSRFADGASLSDAQLVLARALGFTSWPRLVEHLDAMRKASPASAFEAAADAIVDGDIAALTRLLRDDRSLARARSTREHGATLLHYVSANGVENYRQRTPKNAPAIARLLLDAGAEVDATANVYGGGATTLGLVATSIHPQQAGVQLELIDILLDRGARMDTESAAGNGHWIVVGCLANGQPEAAAHLARKGAGLTLEGAAGIGRLDVVQRFVDPDGTLRDATLAELRSAFAYACGYGHANVAAYLIDAGMPPDERLPFYGKGHTALHVAAYEGNLEMLHVLVSRGASVNVTDETWRTTPLAWALHAWGAERKQPSERYTEIVRALVAAGAAVTAEMRKDQAVREDAGMHAALGMSG